MADPLGKERQGAGSCKERKVGVMWKDVTKDEESTMKGRTPPPRPGPSPGRVIFSLHPGDFPGDESVSFPGGLLFSWPLPGSSLTQPRPPAFPLPPSRNGLCRLGASSAEAPKPASPAQPPLGSWSGSFSAFGAKPCHSWLCKGSGASGISVTIGQMRAHLLTP